MTPEEQNKAIAAACGKTYHRPSDQELKDGCFSQFEPNYVRDLNAMHEAEKTLASPIDWANYNVELFKVATNTNLSRAVNMPRQIFRALTATAPQRAEAFLRALNLWKN